MTSRVLITGALHPLALEILRASAAVAADYHPDIPYAEILDRIGEYHALISRSETSVTRELIDRGRKLKVIARAAVGIGNIDVDYATERGILVINTPGKNTKAAARGIRVEEADDPGFKDYQSALKVIVSDHERSFVIGGVVFGEGNYRLSLVNSFTFEVVPDGHILTMVNRDQPGVIGKVGTILGDHGVNISEFELSRNRRGGEAMAVIRVDEAVDKAVLEELRALPFIVSLRRIEI